MIKTGELTSLVTFQLEDEVYGVDIMKTTEIIKMPELRRIPNSPSFFEGMLNLRGSIIPVINFKKLFHFNTFDLGKEKGIIVVQVKDIIFGFIIDKILRVLNIESEEIKQIQGANKEIEKYVGGIIQLDEELISILDIESIMNVGDKSGILTNAYKMDEYIIKKRKERLAISSQQIDKALLSFLNKIQFPISKITAEAVRKYFYKLCLKRDLPPSQMLSFIQSTLQKSDSYNNFNPFGHKYFFDNDEDYNCLKNVLYDVILPTKREEKRLQLKVWNLGCPDGTEAYSMSMLLHSFLPEEEIWEYEIIVSGNDYNVLSKGKEGTYEEIYLTRINVQDKEYFFDKAERGFMRIKEEFKKPVSFDLRTPSTEEGLENIDIIFARNYLIGLEGEALKHNLDLFYDCLNNNGILILSEVEEIDEIYLNFSTREINNRKYYVKGKR